MLETRISRLRKHSIILYITYYHNIIISKCLIAACRKLVPREVVAYILYYIYYIGFQLEIQSVAGESTRGRKGVSWMTQVGTSVVTSISNNMQ